MITFQIDEDEDAPWAFLDEFLLGNGELISVAHSLYGKRGRQGIPRWREG
jgi:hypothetical protein